MTAQTIVLERSIVMDGLEYVSDDRDTEPNKDNYRKERFKRGWNDAAKQKKKYDADVLKTLKWQNLGYRLGKLLGEASAETQEEMYEICVKQQEELLGKGNT